ncbi:MAG: DUF1488 family protein [Alsobacter sp.]
MTYDETIDSIVFRPSRHDGRCVVHRRALRVLMRRDPTPEDSLAFLAEHRAALDSAARHKIERLGLAQEAHFHLNSRDLRRAMPASGPARR